MKPLKALWVGGPPGKTLDNISRNLLKEGVEIVERWDSVVEVMRSKHRIPSHVDVILLNHEMCSHPLQDKIKVLSKKAQKPFVLASFGSRKTVIEMRAKGLISDKLVEVPICHVEALPSKSDQDDAIIAMISVLVDEKLLLLTQQKGISKRLQEIEQRLEEIRYDLNMERKRN
jgi:hypothetical protein